MCMMLYIGSDKELPLIQIDENEHYFYIANLEEHNIDVKCQFSKKFSYYVGSYQGCGCGFYYGFIDFDSENTKSLEKGTLNLFIEEERKRKRSVETLFSFLKNITHEVGEIELFSCWAGDERSFPVINETIEINKFKLGSKFKFDKKQFIKITP